MISDDGVTTLFDDDERGSMMTSAALPVGICCVLRSPLPVAAQRSCSICTPTGRARAANFISARALLLRSRDELGVQLYRIDGWEQLVDFAREFSRRAYQVTESV